MKKRRLKTWPVVVALVFIILFICIISIIKSLNSGKIIKTETIDSIKKYNYSLNNNESSYYKKLFFELEKELNKDKIDEKQYASIISKMFLTDFLSLEYAINKNDVGGVNFVYSDYKDSFIAKAKDTIYANIENNMYKDRTQKLPRVTKVNIKKIEQKEYTSDIINDEKAYYVICDIKYKKDLSYPKRASLILVHHSNKLEIVNMK